MSIIMSRRSIVPMLHNTIRRNILDVGINHHRRTTIVAGAVTAVSNMISSSAPLSASMTATRWFSPLSSTVSTSRSSIPLDTSIIMQQQQQQRCLSSTSSGTSSSSSSSSSEDATTTNHDSSQEPPPVNDAPNDDTANKSNNDAEESTDDVDEAENIDEESEIIDEEEPVVVKEEDATIVAARKQSQQMREIKDALLRSLAEQENTRAIAKRDVEQARQYAIKNFAKSLLDVADNLQRALDAVPKEYRPVTATTTSTEVVPTTEPLAINPDIFKTLYEGIEMTEKGLKKALEGHGVVQYGTVGDLFDPNKHEALMEYNDDTKMNNTVGIVMKCGYTLHSRVLRPAEVGVVKSTMTTTTATATE